MTSSGLPGYSPPSAPCVTSQEEGQMENKGSLHPHSHLMALEGQKCSCACLLQMPPLARPQSTYKTTHPM